MAAKDLGSRLGELRMELAKDLAASEIGTAKNPGRISAIRQEIARIMTIRSERRLGIGKKAVPTAPAPKTKEIPKTGKKEVKA